MDILAVDPGKATGIAIAHIDDDEPMEVVTKAIIPNGVEGFIDFISNPYFDENFLVICESFQLRSGRFTPDLEPVRIEGVLMYRFDSDKIRWQSPADKGMVGDTFLKEHGLWVTGKDVGHVDGRDANDAMLHLFAYAMRVRHIPTLEKYWR